MAVASLVLGIVSIVFACTGPVSIVGMLCGIVGIVLGVFGMKDYNKHNLAVAGLVCSIVGLVLSIIVFASCGCYYCAACTAASRYY